ncbi:MAG: hypothetical protein JXA60_02510 [Candidatus Coatesbacteria bacterium]|nr:hypothetical protein [Candidatus Coatesbacteria bacterium]
MQDLNLPPLIFNRRIEIGIENFYKEFSGFALSYEISISKHKRIEDSWIQEDITIRSIGKRKDKTYKGFEIVLNRIPGIVNKRNGKAIIGFNHIFVFKIPRYYPYRLDKVKIYCKTPLLHPRCSSNREMPVCYIVNGEIDRIIGDIIFNVLLKPDLVKPPSLYKDSDWGLNIEIMKWYQDLNPQKVFEYMLTRWISFYKVLPTGIPDITEKIKPKVTFL